jgi:hypothetical protein
MKNIRPYYPGNNTGFFTKGCLKIYAANGVVICNTQKRLINKFVTVYIKMIDM